MEEHFLWVAAGRFSNVSAQPTLLEMTTVRLEQGSDTAGEIDVRRLLTRGVVRSPIRQVDVGLTPNT